MSALSVLAYWDILEVLRVECAWVWVFWFVMFYSMGTLPAEKWNYLGAAHLIDSGGAGERRGREGDRISFILSTDT